MASRRRRKICFVTGTRAEFGLMASALSAIRDDRRLALQVVATGMHLDRSRGKTIDSIRSDGWPIDRVVEWAPTAGPAGVARATGSAMAGVAEALAELDSDVALVVGDRVEAFAAAAAAHVSGRAVAHVHGGDRAAGQVDDCLRHAITKLAHLHFPATRQSAQRIGKLGEDRWRIHRVGSPGLDGIASRAAPRRDVAARFGPGPIALLLLHPADSDEAIERARAESVFRAVAAVPFARIVIVYPNNDPGAGGIVAAWKRLSPGAGERVVVCPDVPRAMFLGLLRDSAVLVGNSSAGIIEAASFATPVIDVGPRQRGRERGRNVVSVDYAGPGLGRALARVWNAGAPRRAAGASVYAGRGAGRRIANVLASVPIDDRLLRKLIAY